MTEIHNYTFFFGKEMPWKKTEEEDVNIWPDPDIENWEEDEEEDESNKTQ